MTKLMPDPYTVLGIPRGAHDDQMRDAYRRLAKRYHPDLHPGASTSERMRRVNQAWDTLSDPARRARYDADHPRGLWPPAGSFASPGVAEAAASTTASARPWPPVWATGATRSGHDSPAAGWDASSWTAPRAAEPPPRADDGGTSGVPVLPLAAIVVVGSLAIGGAFGGILLPAVLGLAVVLAAGWVLDRAERGA